MSEKKKDLAAAFSEQPHELSDEELNNIIGGNDGRGRYVDPDAYYVHVQSSYLALRTAPEYRYENEIGKMWNGYTFHIYPGISRSGSYVYGYCNQLNMEGWTNGRFLYRYRDPYLD